MALHAWQPTKRVESGQFNDTQTHHGQTQRRDLRTNLDHADTRDYSHYSRPPRDPVDDWARSINHRSFQSCPKWQLLCQQEFVEDNHSYLYCYKLLHNRAIFGVYGLSLECAAVTGDLNDALFHALCLLDGSLYSSGGALHFVSWVLESKALHPACCLCDGYFLPIQRDNWRRKEVLDIW